MMEAKHSNTRITSQEQLEAEDTVEQHSGTGIVPFGLPLPSGPGAIVTVMVLIAKSESKMQRIGVYAAIAGVSLFFPFPSLLFQLPILF
ncbi:hypothetical protein BCY86_07560 [Pajaroellobacter abortibovis]|uniref:UPF0056 membrane protein n=2 Tax=Pajaroellobacter abortibovis TaxID=1882918 RepID=A0A1L6MYQ6_9BACT|nr:hypothetical protein BCY86_07560 [Pajaroellobacter abortibovis]